MPIDWFTVIAQAINFLILVWLLKRFLYKPILRAIDEREKGIASRLAEAESKKAEAQKEHDDFQSKNEAFDRQRAGLLKEAANEVQAERQRLVQEAQHDTDSLRSKRREALRNELRSLSREISRWTQEEVFAITRKTLADLADTDLEKRVVEVFVLRLRAITGPGKEQLATSLKTALLPTYVRSAFDLPPEQQAAIRKALNETFSADIAVRFQVVPDLVSGIELSGNGQKVAWSIADYLATLEKSARGLLNEAVTVEFRADPKPEADAEAEPQAAAIPGGKAVAKVGVPPEHKNGLKPADQTSKADH